MDCKTCSEIVQEEEREAKKELRTWTAPLMLIRESPRRRMTSRLSRHEAKCERCHRKRASEHVCTSTSSLKVSKKADIKSVLDDHEGRITKLEANTLKRR